jgi:alpha-L-fucosidase 2
MQNHTLAWQFPLPTCHHGVPLGNGRMGVLIWGEGNTLRLTLSRPDFWDHRGGMRWTAEMSFARIRELLTSQDDKSLRRVFENAGSTTRPVRPSILPVGRIEVTLQAPLQSATLDMRSGVATVVLKDGRALDIELSAHEPVVLLRSAEREWPTALRTAADLCGDRNARFNSSWNERGFAPPEHFNRNGASGFAQPLPADLALAVAMQWNDGTLFAATDRGANAEAAFNAAMNQLTSAITRGADAIARKSRAWWSGFWNGAPSVKMPHAALIQLAEFGLYKLAASTNPLGGVACGLQGPWIEDNALPAWASDFHFNINVQLCHAPAYAAGVGAHLRPLWDMLKPWEPQLRENARLFLGIDDGLMLPHAVDDRGTNMGGFWTGTVDHACTAWVAKMMFDAWRYGFEDDTFLRERVQPWLEGALNVYRAMAERTADGAFSFPVSVSPEYRGSSFNAWGADASAQLAACHALLDALDTTTRALGTEYCDAWRDFRAHLPRACIESQPSYGWNDPSGDAIVLWRGTPLEESHRHHSHLFGITPMESIDPNSETWRKVIDKTLGQWTYRGMGWWAGWSFGWASQIHARVGNATSAVMMLDLFSRFFVNDGHAGFHNALHRGLTIMGGAGTGNWGWNPMQLDGGQGACTAVYDLLAHDRHGTVALFAGCPAEWDDVSFDNISLPGGFRVSASRSSGRITRLTVRSVRDAEFRYLDPTTGVIHTATLKSGAMTTVI